jgi:hypothetical protein
METIGMKAYHYTCGSYIPAIRHSGFLKLTPSVDRLGPREKGAVWFSTRDDFPPTAIKPIRVDGRQRMLDMPAMDDLLDGVFRFGVDAEDLTPWWQAKHMIGTSNKLMRNLLKVAKERGEKPSSWLIAFYEVTVDQTDLEQWNSETGEWFSVDINDITVQRAVKVEAY